MSAESQTAIAAHYVATARRRSYPPHVIDEAKKCLVDWTAVCLGAIGAPEAQAVSTVMQQWDSCGQARILSGGTASAAAAAMINGTLSHCLDYDDTHIPSVVHASAPLWAAVLAVSTARQLDEELALKAFITGFELAARIGDNGIGIRLNNSGWHATPTLGRLGVAAAVAVLLDLDEGQVSHALGIAATQAGGLTASFGTMAKPFHVGKTAMDGILAAELAAAGFEGAGQILDGPGGLIGTLLQDPSVKLEMAPFDTGWEILRNSFKPYAACQLTHGAIDAARAARAAVGDRRIENIRAIVNPLAVKIAGLRNASTATEGKFSMGFCIALGLRGHEVTTLDFTAERLNDALLVDIASRVEVVASDAVSRTAAQLEIQFSNGEKIVQTIEHAFGSIGNPMGWQELDNKFMALVSPVVSGEENAKALLDVLRNFEKAGSLARMFLLTGKSAATQAA
jgi:2-methylcitrate dehydratase PrpD